MKQEKQSSYFGMDEPKEFNVSYIPHKSGTYRIELDDDIEKTSQFSTAILALEAAKEEDDVEIHLQCNGGNMNATDALIHAMRKCPAHIHIIATGGCHSAATHILLEATSFELSDSFNACLHCGQDGAYGNANEYRIKSAFDAEFRVRKFKESYAGFLTEKEIDDMLNGADIWLDAAGWVERYTKRNEYIAKKVAAIQKSQRRASRTKKLVDTTQ